MLDTLNALSPIDGRYQRHTEGLRTFFSEYGLIKYRVWMEIEYLIALANEPGIGGKLDGVKAKTAELRTISEKFDVVQAQAIKDIEKTTNHDVKAVEYWLRDQLTAIGLEEYLEWIHFGLTSQDVNNTAIPASIKHALDQEVVPKIEALISQLNRLSLDWEDIPMLARTHGQPASPTRLGKEIYVYVERLQLQLAELKRLPITGKFGGATGNFNAHHVAFPQVDWIAFGENFLTSHLGITRSNTTTQIEHYDYFAASMDALKRISVIIIDLCRDVWTYVSMDYFKQKIKAGEVGSSAMPHKVNPIDFENAEGNLGIAIAFMEHLSIKLPISRLQRDLTDSTVLRNVGMPMAYLTIALNNVSKGLSKLLLNEDKLKLDLENNWAVVAEAIQTILRREGFENPYNELKKLTRTNEKITGETMANFIDELAVSEKIKAELKAISPFNYLGVKPKRA
jgi:adenylosuccinate lyase